MDSTSTSSLYVTLGGIDACRAIAVAFYARVPRDPILRPFFPGKTQKCAIEEFSAFLAQLLGGPPEDAQRRWWLSLTESHRRFAIGPAEREAWMRNMIQALDEISLTDAARDTFRDLFEQSSTYIVNVGERPVAATDYVAVPRDATHAEVLRRWNAQQVLDQAVAAIHGRRADRAVALVEGPVLGTYLAGNRSVLAAVLGSMIATGDVRLVGYARKRLLADPSLVRERYGGRTLLHGAAATGDLETVMLLLHLGVDPNVADSGGHTPLYALSNACTAPGAARLVSALIDAGADVDASEGAKRCTALHMAARRGNVEIAAALLDRGAAIEIRDSLGETPLRRAVNCGKVEVAALLVERGGDLDSVGSKRLTPRLAARTNAMKRLFQAYDRSR